MALDELERLQERVDRDPESKLFVPLAEEYKKASMFEEAIDVLIKGLERHPNYMSARVSLGKIYLEKGMFNEAGQEFEKVVSAIPDNLYAHKKLAEIYKNLDDKDKAITELRVVLRLNPTDEIAAKSLASLEERFTVQPEIQETTEVFTGEEEPSEIPVSEQTKETDVEESFVQGVSEEPRVKIRDADTFIYQGRYSEALDIYKKILFVEPGNTYVLQRIEELRALLKLLGRSEEELIVRLNSFLEVIKKRRNEFFSPS
jgi:tetratricopeptide (TPR) repeat protein